MNRNLPRPGAAEYGDHQRTGLQHPPYQRTPYRRTPRITKMTQSVIRNRTSFPGGPKIIQT
ncbi:MAG: hypothetical protein PHI71_06990 [Acidiphilium sp.]|nr:hypothetical protein [Acidiphilium sp.]